MLGSAAMLLSFDVVEDAIPEHDQWHTQEHLPERLAIPGFLRGTRWTAVQGGPRYFVMYEVEQLATLTSEPYLARLNAPSPWTAKMMAFYRGMSRGFCAVTGRCGVGLGQVGLLLHFKPATGAETALRRWLLGDVLPAVPARPGLGSALLLEGAVTPQMTNEQRIRGADAGLDWTLFATGYSRDALAQLMQTDLEAQRLGGQGGRDVVAAIYRMDYTLTNREVDAGPAPRPLPVAGA